MENDLISNDLISNDLSLTDKLYVDISENNIDNNNNDNNNNFDFDTGEPNLYLSSNRKELIPIDIEKQLEEITNLEEVEEVEEVENNDIEEIQSINNNIEKIENNKDNEKRNKKKEIEIEDDMDLDELINDFSKFSEKEDKKKKQIELMLELFRLIGYRVYEQNDLLDIMIMRDKLLEKTTNKILLDKVPELKKVYNTGYLSCLHDNSIYKQKWPAINLLRQILKCNFYHLTPKILSNGYDKLSGKKQVTRVFVIEKILY
jgi:hypothetical protein